MPADSYLRNQVAESCSPRWSGVRGLDARVEMAEDERRLGPRSDGRDERPRRVAQRVHETPPPVIKKADSPVLDDWVQVPGAQHHEGDRVMKFERRYFGSHRSMSARPRGSMHILRGSAAGPDRRSMSPLKR